MKNFLLLVVVFMTTQTIQAQVQEVEASKVPHAVLNNYVKRFGRPQKTTWKKFKLKDLEAYEANFELNGKTMEARYDKTGTWLKTDTPIAETKLPDAVKQKLQAEYAGCQYMSFETVDSPSKKDLYEIELIKGKNAFEVIYESDGKFYDKIQTK